MLLVLLEFDAEAERRIRALWARLAAAGMPQEGQQGYAPHLTLGIFAGVNEVAVTERLDALAESAGPLRVRFAALGCFAAETSVLYAAPIVTRPLLRLHRRVHEALAPLTECANPHYLPNAWVPHSSLALELTPPQLAGAVALLAADWQPFAAETCALSLVRPGPPPETRWRVALG